MVGSARLGLQGLAAMAHVLTRSNQLHDLLEAAADHACAALGAATVSVSQIEPDDDVVRTIINVGDLSPDEERWPRDEIYVIAGDEGLMSAMRERISWVDDRADPECGARERALLERIGKGSSLATAIVVDGQLWGEFYATRHVGDMVFDADAIAYAEVLVAILAAAISRTLREAELADMAFRDSLTGLLNRRALDERAAGVFDLGNDPERRVAVVAVDIDGLKRVNDTAGHAEGDQMIRVVAAALSQAFGPFATSVVARVGGDEFTVVVSGHDVDVVEETINRACQEVSAQTGRIDLSAGIAYGVLTATSKVTATDLFAAADRAQYVAKRTGSLVAVVADGFSA